jgi:hypothetical protein
MGQHGDRLSGEGGKFHFVRGRIAMDMDNRPHIRRQPALIGQFTRQHNVVVFFDHDVSEGYAVISRGTFWSASNCQTDATESRDYASGLDN